MGIGTTRSAYGLWGLSTILGGGVSFWAPSDLTASGLSLASSSSSFNIQNDVERRCHRHKSGISHHFKVR